MLERIFLTRIAANPSQLNLGAFSKEFTAAQAEAASLQVVGHVLLQTKDIITPVLTIVFNIGAIFSYTLFYLTKLIPLVLFGLDLHLDILYVPLAVQEMATALWLIIRGFSQTVLNELLNDKQSA